MPLRFLLDEHIPSSVWTAIIRHNLRGENILDVERIGSPSAPPFGTQDPELLHWAERESRVLISRDKSTLPTHLKQHLEAGGHSPGIMLLRRRFTMHELIEFLALAANASEANEWADRCTFIP